jgi:hypothetical protein
MSKTHCALGMPAAFNLPERDADAKETLLLDTQTELEQACLK